MIVGADVNQSEAVLVLMNEEGAVADGDLPRQVSPAEIADPGERLSEILERLTQHLRHHEVRTLVLTDSSVGMTKPSSVRARAQIEAVLLVAAHRNTIAVQVVHQKSVAKSLGLPASATKVAVRAAVAARLDDAALSGHPDRRARAIGAVWFALGQGPS